MNFPIKVVNYVIVTISLCDQNMIEFDSFLPNKDKWKYCDVIPLLSLLEVNRHQPLLYMSKTLFIIIVHKTL